MTWLNIYSLDYGRNPHLWPDFVKREAIAELYTRDSSWLFDAINEAKPEQVKALIEALRVDHTSERLIRVGGIVDALLVWEPALKHMRREIAEYWSGWRRDLDQRQRDEDRREWTRQDWLDQQEARA